MLRTISLTLLAGSLALTGCASDVLTGIDAPRDIEQFLTGVGTVIRTYDEVMTDRDQGVVLFTVTYGGLTHPPALGLKKGERIGWVQLPEGVESDRFDLRASDGYLMSEAFLEKVRVASADDFDWVALWMLRDPDVKPAIFEYFARTLRTHSRSPDIGLALLDRPEVRNDPEILETLTEVGGGISPYYTVHGSAWQYLAPFLPSLAQHSFTGSVVTDVDGVAGTLTVANTSGRRSLIDYAGSCASDLWLFDNPNRAGQPRWRLRGSFVFGPCRTIPEQREIPVNSQLRITPGSVAVTRILGDSLPAGTYYAVVSLRVNHPQDSVFVLPAGSVTLTRQ